METELKARLFEKENQWQEAADTWRKINRKEDADACQKIADAITKGNAFRKEVSETLGEEPEFTKKNVNKWIKWHVTLRLIYKKHYK